MGGGVKQGRSGLAEAGGWARVGSMRVRERSRGTAEQICVRINTARKAGRRDEAGEAEVKRRSGKEHGSEAAE